MQNTHLIGFQRMDAYGVAKELAVLVHRLKIRDAELRDQAGRASKSAFLQLSERLPNAGVAMRRKYFTCARNSVCEVAAAVDLAIAIDAVDAALGLSVLETAARLCAMIHGLLR